MSNESISKNQITEGVIWKQLLVFFFPILIGTLFQQLYNTVDAIVVGRFIGKTALASVGGSPAVISNIIITCFTGISAGATVIISQSYGAKDSNTLHKALHTAYAFSIVAGTLCSLIGYIITPTLLTMTKTSADSYHTAVLYMRIYFLGILSTFIFNIGSGIMRAIGDSKRPLYYLMVSSFINIILDILFVIVFHLGVAGAAAATVIAQTVSAILVTISLCRAYQDLKIELRQIRFHMPILKKELRIGLPGGFQACMYGLTNIIIQTSINSFGTDATAAFAAFWKMDAIFWSLCGAFGIAISTFAGQNYGAGYLKRVFKSVRVCLGMALVSCGSVIIFLMVLAKPLLAIFTSDPNVVAIGSNMMFTILPSYSIYIFIEIFSGALRGLGDVKVPTLAILGGVMLVRLPWMLFVVPRFHELFYVLISYPLSWTTTAMILIPYYFYRKKKL